MKKAFKKLVTQKPKAELDALQASGHKPSANGPAAGANGTAVHAVSGAAGLSLDAAEQRRVPPEDSTAELNQQLEHSSLHSDQSQVSYPASDSGSAQEQDENGDCLTEPLLDHPRYRKLQDLNRGASGFVQLAENMESGEIVAIKFLERGGSASQRVIARELLNHRECALHPNIVQLKEVFLTKHHLAIALEYADGGDLSEFIDERAQQGIYGCSEEEARWFFQQFIIGLDYCHRMGIANRDIKLDNILLHGRGPRPVVKICDFGYSKDEVAGSICKTACGTPEYMAPEVLTTELYDGKVADIWSCGVMLYVLLEGSFPFARKGDEDMKGARALQMMFGRIIKADFPMPSNVSEDCCDLLRKVLTADPGDRLTIQGIMDHAWFRQDLPAGALQVNSRLKMMDNVRFGQCKQTAEEILDLVNECNAAEDREETAERHGSLDLDTYNA